MPGNFLRPKGGFRFKFGGIKTNASPDALPPDKYALAHNIRAVLGDVIQTRPGQTQKFTAASRTVTDIRAYLGPLDATGSLAETPRYLACDSFTNVFLDTGTLVGGLSNAVPPLPGVAMVPFRPASSPNPWMYIANRYDYRKFSAPSTANVVTQNLVGIREPPSPPEAAIVTPLLQTLGDPNVNAGTCGASSTSTRTTDTIAAVFPWPSPASQLYTLQVGTTQQYQRFQFIAITGAGNAIVEDVFSQFAGSLTISGIYYFSGTTGRCVVVPANVSAGPGQEGQSIFNIPLFAGLRRGALVKIGTEVVMVLSSTLGPDGTISFETSTVNPHTIIDTLSSVPSIEVTMLSAMVPAAAQAISAPQRTYQVTTGIGTISVTGLAGFGLLNQAFRNDDYICIGIKVDNLANLTELRVILDVGDGSFTQNFYYYTITPSEIVQNLANNLTQLAVSQIINQQTLINEELTAIRSRFVPAARGLPGFPDITGLLRAIPPATAFPGSNQWTQVVFPISALTRVGDDQTKTLSQVNAVQFLYNASGTINVAHGTLDFYAFGGSSPDVGDAGAPYLYRVRPRAKTTGVKGNPSPATRYGTNPRRSAVTVGFPSAGFEAIPQMDTWDVFRYGGAVTSWRFIGSTPSTNATFTDNYSDAAALGGDELEFDNFEPWPSVDVPNTGTASLVNGTVAVVNTTDTDIISYLPGTLVQFGGANVYTLWTRPTLISGNSYLLQLVENAGTATGVAYTIQEPLLANQHLPYLWGPDANGTVFAAGDAHRPGNVYFSKNYAPDAAPDTYNLEITPPSEPLMGGVALDGLSFVASTERWWALYPQPDNPAQRYNVVQQPLPRGLAAPYGICTDGRSVYWWAKDGIWSSTEGSLTDADLYNLFPHEGVLGQDYSYNGYVTSAPDYSRAGTFRLAYANSYLYATYQDTAGLYHQLVCDLRTKAWRTEDYTPSVACFYHPEQQAGTLLTSTARYDELLMGTTTGIVAKQTDNANDLGGSIPSRVATAEWDGGDIRAPKQWGDIFLDATPVGLSVFPMAATPMSLGTPVVGTSGILAPSSVRIRQPISVGGVVVSDFMGLQVTWGDDFTKQTAPSKLFSWQPSYVIQPARAIAWATFGTAFGLTGYMHIRQVAIAWVSTAPITLTITSFDGLSPAPITIPSSGGAYKKQMFPLTANKGLLYAFQASSSANFQLWLDDSEAYVGQWGRTGAYSILKALGADEIAQSTV